MALSCGRRRQRGQKGSGSCRHFHVHYHLPRRVSAFSFPRLLPRFFSLLSAWVLVPPVLFLALLVFLALFVWFTLLYFIRSLWNKDINSEFFERNSNDHGSDSNENQGEEVAEGQVEEKVLKVSSELFTANSSAAEDCTKRFVIEEVHTDSGEYRNIPMAASSGDCVNYDVQTDDEKFIEEVIIFEIIRWGPEAIASSERHQVQDFSIDWFEGEIKSRNGTKSGDSFPTVLSTVCAGFRDFSGKNELVELTMDSFNEMDQNMPVLQDSSSHCCVGENHCKYGEECFDDKEAPASKSSETSDFIDKYETRDVVLDDCGNNDTVITVIALGSIDGSAKHGIDSERGEDILEQKDTNNLAGLLDSIPVVVDPQQEIHKVVVSDESKLPEVFFLNAKQIDHSPGESSSFPNENRISGFPFNSVCKDKNGNVAYSSALSLCNAGVKDEQCEDNIEEASSFSSAYRGSVDENQKTQEVPDCLANGDNTCQVSSLESSIREDVGDHKRGPQHHGGIYVELLMCLLDVKIKIEMLEGRLQKT
uniref:Uncharacterized protein n=1 Tax=Leersia perrieri TaxID=77586 RepID=A0A0D9WEI2_9ORYZ